MPKIKSAKKALRVSARKRRYNKEVKENLKKLIRTIRKERKKEDLQKLISLLDKAASKGVIHKNKAARLKSRLSKLVEKGKEVVKEVKRKKKVAKKKVKKKG